ARRLSSHDEDTLGVAAGEHVVEGGADLPDRIGAGNHLVEEQVALRVVAEELRHVDLRAAAAVERVDVNLVPLEELEVHRHQLLAPRTTESPTPPVPITATDSPFFTLATFVTVP